MKPMAIFFDDVTDDGHEMLVVREQATGRLLAEIIRHVTVPYMPDHWECGMTLPFDSGRGMKYAGKPAGLPASPQVHAFVGA